MDTPWTHHSRSAGHCLALRTGAESNLSTLRQVDSKKMPLFCFILTYFDDARFVNGCGIIFAIVETDDHIKYFWTQQPESLCSVLQKNKNKKRTVASTLLSICLQVAIHFGHFSKLAQTFIYEKYELFWSPCLTTGPNPWKGSGSPPHDVNILRPVLCGTGWETFCRLRSFFWEVNLLEKNCQTVPWNNQTKLWQWEKTGQDMNHSTKDTVNSPASALARAADRC